MELNFNTYQKEASGTEIYTKAIRKYVADLNIPDPSKEDKLIELLSLAYVVLGLTGEAGEIANKVKKIIRDEEGHIGGKREDLLKENGDVLWYTSQISKELNENFDKTAANNINKLLKRKENGTTQGSGDDR